MVIYQFHRHVQLSNNLNFLYGLRMNFIFTFFIFRSYPCQTRILFVRRKKKERKIEFSGLYNWLLKISLEQWNSPSNWYQLPFKNRTIFIWKIGSKERRPFFACQKRIIIKSNTWRRKEVEEEESRKLHV